MILNIGLGLSIPKVAFSFFSFFFFKAVKRTIVHELKPIFREVKIISTLL